MTDASTPSEPAEPGGRAAPDGPTQVACINSTLRRAARRLGQLFDEALAPIGLTSSQARLLAEVGAVEGEDGPTLRDLAERLGIQTSALTHALRPLVRDGLVRVRPDARDRRAKHAVLTPEGRARMDEMTRRWVEANARAEAALGAGAAATLRALADEVSSERFLAAFAAGGRA